MRERLTRARPRRVWHVGAWRDGQPVGHALLDVTTGRLGARRTGIGRVLTIALLALVGSVGCEVATVNATPEGELLYRQLGFRPVGVAQTWWR